ncbi:MAG: 50S ribosomal protein L13 [Thermotogae bacterium]|nr:50S ribosomal protein L13 [Thermotogota bacterium]
MEGKTYFVKSSEVERKWYIVDAKNKPLGRLAARLSLILQGKNKVQYTPNADLGDYVVVINAEKIMLSGRKLDQKKYYRHSGYIGGLKEVTARKMLEKYPDRLIKYAVKGMLPKNKLRESMLKKLKVCVGSEHPYVNKELELLDL